MQIVSNSISSTTQINTNHSFQKLHQAICDGLSLFWGYAQCPSANSCQSSGGCRYTTPQSFSRNLETMFQHVPTRWTGHGMVAIDTCWPCWCWPTQETSWRLLASSPRHWQRMKPQWIGFRRGFRLVLLSLAYSAQWWFLLYLLEHACCIESCCFSNICIHVLVLLRQPANTFHSQVIWSHQDQSYSTIDTEAAVFYKSDIFLQCQQHPQTICAWRCLADRPFRRLCEWASPA